MKKYPKNLFGNSGKVRKLHDQELVDTVDPERRNMVVDSLIK